MRQATIPNIQDQVGYVSSLGTALPAGYLFRASAQLMASSSSAAGTFTLQGSNDPGTPVNWSTLGTPVTVSGAGAYLIAQVPISYQWIRTIFTSTLPGHQLITTVPDSSDSLNGAYFLLQSQGGTHKYAVYLDTGTATPPVVAGYTAEQVVISTGATAAAVATALSSVLNGLAGISSAIISPTILSANMTVVGTFVPAVDSIPMPTGFTFAVDTSSNGTISANIKTLGD